MYLGLAIVLLGWAWYLAHPLAALGAPAFAAWMNGSQIPREERALEQLFGAAFAQYRTKVRRWL
jgi:protein-S-isoprenylcysteine O-methyltransferase Ste14